MRRAQLPAPIGAPLVSAGGVFFVSRTGVCVRVCVRARIGAVGVHVEAVVSRRGWDCRTGVRWCRSRKLTSSRT
nr:MAG TPA: hypothetical protein [Caudoviricetes sp.]